MSQDNPLNEGTCQLGSRYSVNGGKVTYFFSCPMALRGLCGLGNANGSETTIYPTPPGHDELIKDRDAKVAARRTPCWRK